MLCVKDNFANQQKYNATSAQPEVIRLLNCNFMWKKLSFAYAYS